MDVKELISILQQVKPDTEVVFGYSEGSEETYRLIEIGGVKEIQVTATNEILVVLTPDDDYPNIHLN